MEEKRPGLDWGYDVLLEERWEAADTIFRALLEADPHSGMACLGRAMAAKQIPSRAELAENWEALREDPEFLELLQPAKSDFLPWLTADMEKARRKKSSPPDVSRMEPGRRLLLGFAGVQVLLYFLAAFLFGRTMWHPENVISSLMASVMMGAIACGLPAVLGPLYGNSILKNGRFCGVLKVLNNLVGVLGCVVSGILVAAFASAFRAGIGREDWYDCAAYLTAFLAHLLAMVVPGLLRKMK